MRNRQYHPGLGRFLQADPIGYLGGMNLYACVGGDPVNLVDPWGLQEAPPDDVGPVIVTGTRRYVSIYDLDGGYGGYGAPIDFTFEDEVWVEDVVVIGPPLDRCRPLPETGGERLLRYMGYFGDGLFVAGALTGNPVLMGAGGVISIGAEGIGIAIDYDQGDHAGMAERGVGIVTGAIPGARWFRRGRAILDLGRDRLGRFLPNWRGRRSAGDRIAGAAQDNAASSLFGALCES